MTLDRNEVGRIARETGFASVAVTSLDPLEEDGRRFCRWLEQRYHAEMSYLSKSPDKQSSPAFLFSEASSVLTFATNYYARSDRADTEEKSGRSGRIAQYAQGNDYHKVIPRMLSAFIRRLEELTARSIKHRACVDAAPVLERALAKRAGLGFFGKSANLILPKLGSYFFLSELFVDLVIPPDDLFVPVNCGTCTRCIDACPTNAFVSPYLLDSNRCISYHTIENRASIPEALRPLIGDWIFGCDVCQDVCPFNRFSRTTEVAELTPNDSTGPTISLIDLLRIGNDQEFRGRFEGTAVMRAKRRGIVRNACIAAANLGATELAPQLEKLAASDPDAIVREHSAWAAERLRLHSKSAHRENSGESAPRLAEANPE